MSMSAPPPPLGLPPPERSVRMLRVGWVLGAVFGIGTLIALIAWYSLQTLGEQHIRKAESSALVRGQGESFSDLLTDAPSGTEVPMPARKQVPTEPPPAPSPQVTQAAAQPPLPVDDNDTDAAIAARKAAWSAYYQQLLDLQRGRVERIKAGLTADTETDPQQQAAGAAGGNTGAGGLLGSGGPLGGGNKNQGTDFFSSVASSPATDYLPFSLTNPISPFELKAGDVITGKLMSGLDSDSPGVVVAMVSKNVYDYATGNYILIPQGSRLFGTCNTAIAYGQTRVWVAWTRVIYPGPCSQSLDIGAMPGADATGQAGFDDITENHYGKIFLNALLVSLFSAGIQLSQPASSAFSSYNPTQTAAGAVGQQLGQLGSEFARRGMDIPPTQRIGQGYVFAILATKDIAFSKPWVEGDCKPATVQVAVQ
jgi:type IV secretory pathway VirB10-like protein